MTTSRFRPVSPARALRRAAAALGALALAAGLAGCAPQSAPGATTGAAGTGAAGETITIGLTYTPNIQFAPFYLAAERGYFDDAGVKVELRHHGQSEDLFGALETGAEDLVYAGGDEIVQARSGGVDVTSVATLYGSYPAALIVPADSPIQSAADLRGRTVGVPGPYGQTYSALLAMLAGAGLTTSDLTIEHIGYTQQAALTGGKVEGVMGFANNDAVQLQESGFPVRTISAFPDGVESLVGPALGASSAVLAEHPDAVRAILAAVERATKELIADPNAAVDASTSQIPTLTSPEAKANALATLQATVPFLQSAVDARFQNHPETWLRMTTFMADHGLLSGQQPTVDDCSTNDYLPSA